MTENINAKQIFEAFAFARMRFRSPPSGSFRSGLPEKLAHSLTSPDNASEMVDGVERIWILEGENCWAGECFYFDQSKLEVSVTGRKPVPVQINADKLALTADGFYALLSAARRAATLEDT